MSLCAFSFSITADLLALDCVYKDAISRLVSVL